MGLNPKGRNWGSLVNWDDLGKFYAGFIVSWTVILYAGVGFLIINRHVPFIKIRNLPLAIAAVSFLHIYLVKIFLAYTTNGHFLCSAEFWIMSIYLPFGIALFQANLAQLRSISDQQISLAYPDKSSADACRKLGLLPQLLYRWHCLPGIKRIYSLIALGMAVQLLMTGLLYGTTPTLQGDWSSYGSISHAKGQALCRKSLEWIPSAFWQLAWSWVYGPYLLFKVRDIHDVHHWRLQIIYSVVSGLPGSPLWLAALYSPAFKPINPWWVPPMWLAPGIIVMQLTTIFFPVYEVLRSRSEMRTTLDILKSWEDRRGASTSINADADRTSSAEHSTTSSARREMCSMGALEKALANSPEPLLKFAATRDFTAENVLFLMQVRRWKEAFALASHSGSNVTGFALAQLFNSAMEIYTSRVNDKTTEFPINIESKVRQDLDAVFGPAMPTSEPLAEDIKYYDAQSWIKSATAVSAFGMNGSSHSDDSANTLTALPGTIAFTEKPEPMFPPHPGVSPLGEARTKMRPGFDGTIFDTAESSIKYLVLTNTWQKFVKDQRSVEMNSG
jgi:hypothetical protein